MSAARLEQSRGTSEFFRMLAGHLAPHLREQLGLSAHLQPAYYDQTNSPLGRRQYLSLVRRRVLVGHKAGRRVLVLRDDVHAFIARCKPEQAAQELTQELLSEWGLARGTHP